MDLKPYHKPTTSSLRTIVLFEFTPHWLSGRLPYEITFLRLEEILGFSQLAQFCRCLGVILTIQQYKKIFIPLLIYTGFLKNGFRRTPFLVYFKLEFCRLHCTGSKNQVQINREHFILGGTIAIEPANNMVGTHSYMVRLQLLR